MPASRLRCALLTTHRYDWLSAITLASPGLDLVTLHQSTLGISELPNPFGLPEDTRADVVLLAKSAYEWMRSRHGERLNQLMDELARRSDLLVALDGSSDFALGLPPAAIERATIVVKAQGLFRDRELYNYSVGPWWGGTNWTEKRRSRAERYRADDLDKLRLSLPCFAADLPAVRREARRRETSASGTVGRPISPFERLIRNSGERLIPPMLALAGASRRRLDVHCASALTNAQRLDVMRNLEGLSGKRGITPEDLSHVAGTDRDSLLPADDELIAAAERYRVERVGRLRYWLELARHGVVVAPAGYGELTFRHAEAWRAGAALVCQDLGHVEMMFQIVDGENAVFCRHDLEDLRGKVDELLADEPRRRQIADQGARRYTEWVAHWADNLYEGVEAHIRRALAPTNPSNLLPSRRGSTA
jgi:Glycosyl transferases group 1